MDMWWQGRRAFLAAVIALTAMSGALTAVSLARDTSPKERGHADEQGDADEPGDAEDRPQPRNGSGTDAVPGELLVRFSPSADSGKRAAARRDAGTSLEKRLTAGIELLRVKPGVSVAEAKARLEANDAVLYAEPNFYRHAARMPNDASFGSLWGLNNTGQPLFGVAATPDADIDAPEAWDVTTGNTGIVVAVVDSGLDMAHRDLAPNVWTNPGESGGGKESNRRDDDLDGFVDDFHGWDWVDSDNNPQDGYGHGTHVAGTIGARGDDGFGVAGVDWSARLMPLRVLDDQGKGTLANVIQAYAYAGKKGARVVNASFGGGGFSRSEYDVIRGLPDILFVVAAGNSGTDNDRQPDYPCAYDLGNLVCVAATNQNDRLASFSNYGVTSVDLGAPGTNILSSWLGGGHKYLNGTSMATPHVAGAAALLLSRSPAMSATTVKSSLLQAVDPKPDLAGTVASGGRLNLARALGVEPDRPAAPPTVPVVVPDRTPPQISLRVRRREKLRRALRRGVRARVLCSEPCHLAFRVLVGKKTGRRIKLRSGHGRAVIGHRLAFDSGGTKTVILRLKARAKRRLARTKRARLLVTVTATDGAGNISRRQRALSLYR